MATALAFEADISAEAHNRPFIRATGVRLAQAQQIIELEIGEHLKSVGSAASVPCEGISLNWLRRLYTSPSAVRSLTNMINFFGFAVISWREPWKSAMSTRLKLLA